MAGLLSLTKHW